MSLFLELDSTFRNRQKWPLPAEFEVPVSQTGRNTQINMIDPVCPSLPINTWTGASFDVNSIGSGAVQGVVHGICSAPIITLDPSGAAVFQKRENYYSRAVIRNLTQPAQVSTVLSSKHVGGGRMQVVLASFSFLTNPGDIVAIIDSSDFSDPSNPVLFVPLGLNSCVNQVLYNETIEESRLFTYYADTSLLRIEGSIVGWTITDNFSLRPSSPNFVCAVGAGSSKSQIVVTGTAASSGADFQNWFVRFPKVVYDNSDIPPQDESRRIVAYDKSLNIITVNPPLSAPPTGLKMQLMQSGYDNATPFNVRMSMSGEIPAYNVRLIRLTLPNLEMAVGTGGKPAFSNFFYVELSNPDIPQAQFYNIFSNNPYSTRALFRVTVRNIENPNLVKFVPLKGDIRQTIRIKLDSTMRLRVFIPATGETFQTVEKDTTSPNAPKPDLQICALFEFTQV